MSTSDQQQTGESEIARWQREIGYGEPPVHTRFAKGRSGNPGGRPRGITPGRAANLILKEIYRLIKVREGDKVKKMPTLQAIIRNQLTLAAKGNGRAPRDVIAMALAIEQKAAAKAGAEAATRDGATDNREVSDMDLARWILSVLESAAK
jgi:hypothetical protein